MKNVTTPILFGLAIATAGTILMLSLIGLKMLGPAAIRSEREMIGGTILFLMLYLFLLVGIYFVLKISKEQNNNQLSFKEGMVQGLVLSFTTALASVIFTFLFYEILNPEYVDKLLLAMEEKMNFIGIPKDKIDLMLTEKLHYYSTYVQAGYSFIGNLITGVAFTLLLSFFLKTKN